MYFETKLEMLSRLGFIYKRLSKNWYLCRIYADPHKLLYHVVIPLRIKK